MYLRIGFGSSSIIKISLLCLCWWARSTTMFFRRNMWSILRDVDHKAAKHWRKMYSRLQDITLIFRIACRAMGSARHDQLFNRPGRAGRSNILWGPTIHIAHLRVLGEAGGLNFIFLIISINDIIHYKTIKFVFNRIWTHKLLYYKTNHNH